MTLRNAARSRVREPQGSGGIRIPACDPPAEAGRRLFSKTEPLPLGIGELRARSSERPGHVLLADTAQGIKFFAAAAKLPPADSASAHA
jgi:hypothetical protein